MNQPLESHSAKSANTQRNRMLALLIVLGIVVGTLRIEQIIESAPTRNLTYIEPERRIEDLNKEHEETLYYDGPEKISREEYEKREQKNFHEILFKIIMNIVIIFIFLFLLIRSIITLNKRKHSALRKAFEEEC